MKRLLEMTSSSSIIWTTKCLKWCAAFVMKVPFSKFNISYSLIGK